MPDTLEQHERFRETYIPLLAEEIQHPGTGHKGLMPGARNCSKRSTSSIICTSRC